MEWCRQRSAHRELFAQQGRLPFHFDQTQILEEGRRLTGDCVKDVFSGPGEILITALTIKIEKAQKRRRTLSSQRDGDDGTNRVRHQALPFRGDLIGDVGEDEIILRPGGVSHHGVRDRGFADDLVSVTIASTFQAKIFSALA
jgi:hypothetical protein